MQKFTIHNLHFRVEIHILLLALSCILIMERKIIEKFRDWKNRSKGKSALLVDGARRIGKSYAVEAFARAEYKSYLLIDFSYPRPGTLKCFQEDCHDLDIFFAKLSAIYGVQLFRRESVVIFDEVQLYPPARQLIKQLVKDGRYDYMETGSLISLYKNVKDILIPSEEVHLQMFPMDFEEFLWAAGDHATVPFLKTCFEKRKPLGQALHRKVLNDFRKYMLVGGMPQAVEAYMNTGNFGEADYLKKQILSLYLADVGKYAGNDEQRVYSILKDIPGQLSKKEKKFKLADINKNARMRQYEDAFAWLDKAMMVNRCVNATDPSVGLSMSTDYTTQKCYMGDTGLLVTQAFRDDEYADNILYKSVLLDKLNVNEGMLTENIVAQMLRCNGHHLYFYSRVDSANRENNMEIDFLISNHKRISPIEVKSSTYKKHSSLDKFCTKFGNRLGERFVLYPKDVMIKDGVTHLPLYMAMFL